ncbi:MAG: hypothetical protein ACI4JW_05055 [Oscillospiraceae bacterium]
MPKKKNPKRSNTIHLFLAQKLISHSLGKRIIKEEMFRAEFFAYMSLIINSLYAIVQLVSSIIYHSFWFGALAVYHILLAVMRFLLLRPDRSGTFRRDYKTELCRYRLCGVVLLLMTPVFASILIIVIHKNSHAEYAGFLIYLAAIYAFSKIVVAIKNVIKFRKCGSPVLSAAKIISLIAAMISTLTLETAIISRYGSMENPVFYQGMIGTFGGAVCVFVLITAIFMIVRANERMKEYSRHS